MLLLFLSFLPLLWLAAALIMSSAPADRKANDETDTPGAIAVALISNGWHVDLALPLKAGGIDLSSDFPHADANLTSPLPFAAIGWGDRAFYLETPKLSDLKFTTALNALLGRGPAVLHVTHLNALPEGPGTRRIWLDEASFARLAISLQDSLQRGADGKPLLVGGRSYGGNDAFYEARGHYTPIVTCNEWLARHLRRAGLPLGSWTPLARGLVD